MKFLETLLSEKSLNEINASLGEELTKQVNEKVGSYSINVAEEKLIPKTVFDTSRESFRKQVEDRDKQLNYGKQPYIYFS